MTEIEQLNVNGFCFLKGAVAPPQLGTLMMQLDRVLQSSQDGVLESRGQAYGVRNLLQLCPSVVEVARLPRVREFAKAILGDDFGVVRALLFDKPPQRSWTLPWHRDRTIAVREIPNDLYDFSRPTRKAGVPHLIAPDWLLNRMLTLRLSLDAMTPENGPLVVLPGSHSVLSAERLATAGEADSDLAQLASSEVRTILCQPGDIFVMRPLLAHSSLLSTKNCLWRRRVLHLELSAVGELPPGFDWFEFAEV